MTAKSVLGTRIFLSYRRDDVPDAVDRIADRLRDRFGERNVFVDVDAIRAGEKWQDALFQALDECEVILVVIGPDWMRPKDGGGFAVDDPDDFVRREIEIALEREISVIPVLWADAALPSREALPAAVQGLTAYQAFGMRREHFDLEVRLLYERVEAQIRLFATLGRRAASFAIDVIPPLLLTAMVQGGILTFWLLLSLYHALALGTTGWTLGRWLMGTRAESDQTGFRRWLFALARPLLGYPIVLLSGLGTLQMVLHPQHVALHDRLFHTRVLQTRRRPIAAGHLRIDASSRGFDAWLFKTLIGARLGFVIWWAKSFFGMEQVLAWVEHGMSGFARGGTTSGVDVAAASQPAATGLTAAGAETLSGVAAGVGGVQAAGALAGAGVLGVGAVASMAAPLVLGAILAAGSLMIFDQLVPRLWGMVDESAEQPVDDTRLATRPPAPLEPTPDLPPVGPASGDSIVDATRDTSNANTEDPFFPTSTEPRLLDPEGAELLIESYRPENLESVEGTVELRIWVDREGNVPEDSVSVIKGSGRSELDEAAMKAVVELKFEPGTSGGVAVGIRRIQQVRFRNRR